MKPIHWKRCFLVSLIVAVFATPLSMSFYSAASYTSGEEVFDISKIDSEILSTASEKEAIEHVKSIPTKKLSFIERFIYPFTHPQIWLFFLQGLFTWFIGLFVATALVTYLNIRNST